MAPCFATSEFALDIAFGSARFPLLATRIAGTYSGNPPTQIVNGLMQAFLPESAAAQAVLPASVLFVGGQTLSSILPGGAGCCSPSDDRDLGPDGVTRGWWMYANYTAQLVQRASTTSVPLLVESKSISLSAYPNPLSARTTLAYGVNQAGPVELVILDARGRLINTLLRTDQEGRVVPGGLGRSRHQWSFSLPWRLLRAHSRAFRKHEPVDRPGALKGHQSGIQNSAVMSRPVPHGEGG